MPTKTKKPHRTSKTSGKTTIPLLKHSSKKKKTKDESIDSEQRFVGDLLIRGEAEKPLADGELPPGATHKIVENEDENGDTTVQVERERFSLY